MVFHVLPQHQKMDKLQNIYYQSSHLWKGQKAIRDLRELNKEKSKVIKQWLLRQAFWQVHSPPPKCVDRPHYEMAIPNEMHQFDLLYMPTDTLYRNEYKYILSGIYFTSRYKVARPMRMKQTKDHLSPVPKYSSVRMVMSSKQG